MQPLESVLLRRPFHWGIVMVSDVNSGGQIPDVDPGVAVSANEHGLVVLVRHAQDVQSLARDVEWAEVSVLVRHLPQVAPLPPKRREIVRGLIRTPSGRISIGDADGDIVVSGHQDSNLVMVTVESEWPTGDHSPDSIWLDLMPAT